MNVATLWLTKYTVPNPRMELLFIVLTPWVGGRAGGFFQLADVPVKCATGKAAAPAGIVCRGAN
jgi:hypothetical protein